MRPAGEIPAGRFFTENPRLPGCRKNGVCIEYFLILRMRPGGKKC